MGKRKSRLAGVNFVSPLFFSTKNLIISTLFIFTLTSCYNEPELIGKDLLPDEDIFEIQVDTSFQLSAYTVSLDSIFTYNASFPTIGYIKNDVFGSTKSEYAFEVGVGAYEYFKKNAFNLFPSVDSAFISFKLFDKFVESSTPLTFRLFELKDTLSNYNGFESYDDEYHPFQLSSTTYSGDSVLKFYLPNYHVQKILRSDTSVVSNDSIFKQFFKGYIITCDNLPGNGGFISRFNLSINKSGIGYYIYFHNFSEDSLLYKLTIGSTQNRINILKHDYSLGSAASKIRNLNDTINQDSVFYLQGLGGVRGMLKLDDVATWIQKMPIAIHKAELRIQLEEGMNMPNDSLINTIFFNRGRSFRIYDNGLNYIPLYDYSITDTKYQSSKYYRPKEYYSFNITYHLQQLLKGKITQNSIYIEPENFTTAYSQTVLRSGNHSKPIKLIITYTKIN